MGRLIARIHAVGARQRFVQRLAFDVDSLVREAGRAVMRSALLPSTLLPRYRASVEQAAGQLDRTWAQAAPVHALRLHGDCHPGNVLWTDAGPSFVDLDDARNGPAVQDLWMLLSGDAAQRDALLEGYAQFRDFDYGELALIPALRLMRMIHYAGWIAARWDDPAFPRAFPYAAEACWWEEHVNDIVEATTNL
jgi:Ser/Thr protein kinase RdoA (MazF antagonist)